MEKGGVSKPLNEINYKRRQNVTLIEVILLQETMYSCLQLSICFWNSHNVAWSFQCEPNSSWPVLNTAECSAKELKTSIVTFHNFANMPRNSTNQAYQKIKSLNTVRMKILFCKSILKPVNPLLEHNST
jgi:hypothetical protein